MIHGRTCHLCEAMCGVLIEVEGEKLLGIRGDPNDPLSRGHICPKGAALADLHTDPDRLKRPLIRDGDGFKEVGWDEAFDAVAAGLKRVQAQHGRDAVAVYMGNPTVHALGAMTHGQLFFRHLRTRSRYSATSLDQLPHMLASLEMYGHQLLVPIPDLDRAHGVIILGANPLASNGSMMSAPGVKRRLKDIQARGGRIVVVDPRRTETADLADAHHFIRPGTDAALLACLAGMLVRTHNLAAARVLSFLADEGDISFLTSALAPFADDDRVDDVAAFTGLSREAIVSLAADLQGPHPSVVYGRFGVCTQDFGGLTGWLLNVVNILSGNLDREGGVMFTKPAADLVGMARFIGQRGSFGRRRSRVRGAPAFSGEFPAACLVEEMEVAGKGQVKALITHAGNPVLSTPDGARLERALPGLDFMVCIDPHLNETTRHAHVILPPTTGLEREHYDLVFNVLAVRNTARYSAPLFPRHQDARHDWEIFNALAARMAPQTLRGRAENAAVDVMMGKGPSRPLNVMLRAGPWRTSLKALQRAPHGLDFGPLQPCLPERLQTRDKKLRLAPALYRPELKRLLERMTSTVSTTRAGEAGLVLIGRRELRSNNSWMHNSERLMGGKNRCTVMMHPQDAAARGLNDGDDVDVTSSTGRIQVPLEVTAGVMVGVVSIPHGFGHGRPGTRLRVAAEHAGASINDVTDAGRMDALTGNASFSGTPVEVCRRPNVEGQASKASPQT